MWEMTSTKSALNSSPMLGHHLSSPSFSPALHPFTLTLEDIGIELAHGLEVHPLGILHRLELGQTIALAPIGTTGPIPKLAMTDFEQLFHADRLDGTKELVGVSTRLGLERCAELGGFRPSGSFELVRFVRIIRVRVPRAT